MLSFINIILIVLAILAVFFVISGYKENFELMPKSIKETDLFNEIKEVKAKKKMTQKIKEKKNCRPIYNCRRVGYFCSKIN